MGVYAETSGASIICNNSTTAKKVYKKLKAQAEKGDKNGNSFAQDIEQDGITIFFTASSGRVQNLEYQIAQIWEEIKDIDGIKELQAPFLVEDEGVTFVNDNKE